MTNTKENNHVEQIISFWFRPETTMQWFIKDPAFDQAITDAYESLYLDAKAGKCDDWLDSAKGCLALIILLDQFPRNMYRGNAKSFATDSLARKATHHAIAQDYAKQLSDDQIVFLYMPLMHSESLEDQTLSVELYTKLGREHNRQYAKLHYDIIKEFGRFPHRNKILKRKSTKEEQAHLANTNIEF